MEKSNDTKKKVKIYHYDNAIVTVEFADVSEEENERRMKLIHDAARDLIISTMINKKKKEREMNNPETEKTRMHRIR